MEGNHFHLPAIASLLPQAPTLTPVTLLQPLGDLSISISISFSFSFSLIIGCRLKLAATPWRVLHLSQSFIELLGRASDPP